MPDFVSASHGATHQPQSLKGLADGRNVSHRNIFDLTRRPWKCLQAPGNKATPLGWYSPAMRHLVHREIAAAQGTQYPVGVKTIVMG